MGVTHNLLLLLLPSFNVFILMELSFKSLHLCVKLLIECSIWLCYFRVLWIGKLEFVTLVTGVKLF
jgi:hypothetical protein